MIYLDNAATSFPKPSSVYDEVLKFMRGYCANPGRGGHEMSVYSGRKLMSAREKISSFFNIKDPIRLCFTKNTTEALNIGIKGLLKENDHVIITGMEHNSVIRPLKALERERGVEISIARGKELGKITGDDIKRLVKKNTALVITTISSNVNGIIMPVKEIGQVCRSLGIPLLVDGAQGAGTIEIDVQDMNIDLFAFPGHKGLMGPQGTGGLYIREGIKINSLMEGGTGSDSKSIYQPEIMPDYFESGTLNTPGFIGLAAGVEFIEETSLKNIRLHKNMLIKRLHLGLKEIKNIILYSDDSIENNSGIAALNFRNADSSEVSDILDKKYSIATRAGHHCAPLAHETLGTDKMGLVRLSVGYFNTIEEIDHALDAFREMSSWFN